MTNYKKELIKVCSVQSSTGKTGRMNKFIRKELAAIPGITYYMNEGNIYVTKGKALFYPCVVSHTDTVHEIHKEYKIIENNGCLIALSGPFQVGTGGDDKVGIFMCLELLKAIDNIKIAFFRDEENGCTGSRLADPKFFNNVGYILQADRRGCKGITESISGTTMLSDEFKQVIKPVIKAHKRKYIDGMMTDVQELARKYPVSMCNIECGYYEPHSDQEYIVIDDVLRTLVFMHDCIVLLGNKQYECKREYKQLMTRKWARYELYLDKYRKQYPELWDEVEEPVKVMHAPICPQCLQSDMQHDDTLQDWYCLNCMTYLNELKRWFA